MPFKRVDSIQYYYFDLLQSPSLVQGIFTRLGGVSPAPWQSLNVGGTVGDERANVVENRRRVFDALRRPVESLYDVWQVHGDQVVWADSPRPLETAHIKADAILTDRPEVTLFMRFADCVPIFLHDPIRNVIGIAHAGWQGTVLQIGKVVVEAMKEKYGSQPADILAGIGPSIGPDQYEIGPEVVEKFGLSFGADASGLLSSRNGATHLNLWEANRLTLERAGVKSVQVAGICTASAVQDWYSHRKEDGLTGRFGALLALKG